MTPPDQSLSSQPAHGATAAAKSARSSYVPILDVIRFIAIAMVVGIHCLADVTKPNPEFPDLPDSRGVAIHGAIAVCVPLFIMISGALNLGPRALARGDAAFLKARFTRLVPAAIFWTLFYHLVMVSIVLAQPVDRKEFVGTLFTANQYPHLYFLWLIMGLYILTPIFGPFVQRSGTYAWLTALGATAWGLLVYAAPIFTGVLLGKESLGIGRTIATFALLYMGHYLLGYAVVAAPPRRSVSIALLLLGFGLLGAMAYIRVTGANTEGLWQLFQVSYQSPVVVAASLSLFAGLYGTFRDWRVSERAKSILRALGNASFGVFLFHFVPLYFLREEIDFFGIPTFESQMVLWVVVLVGSWIVSLIAARIPFVRALF